MNRFKRAKTVKAAYQPGDEAYMLIEPDEVQRRAPGWYDRWRKRIHAWVSKHSDSALASIVLLVPDLFILITRLVREPHVPLGLKAQLALAAAYVLSPIDFMPEAMLGVIGLAEDAGVMALVLYGLKNLQQVDAAVLRDNWPGWGDVEQVIDEVHTKVQANRERIMGVRVWQKIEQRFGRRSGRKQATNPV